MANINCLKGMRCPKCGEYGPFYIEVITTVLMHDDGSDSIGSDQDWDGESHCTCKHCMHHATVGEFRDA
jgi:hypothetical protein